MNKITNDNGPSAAGERLHGIEPHGEAALLLSECLLHGLIDNSILSVSQAVDIVDSAFEVRQELADEHGPTSASVRHSLAMLTQIRNSLSRDLPDPEG